MKIKPGIEDNEVLQVLIKDIMECLFTIRIKPSNNLSRIGKNVYSIRYISSEMSKRGGSIHVKGLYGDLELEIPAGTKTYTNFQLADQGFQVAGSDDEYGDHFVLVKVNKFDNYRSRKRKRSYPTWKKR